MTEANTIIPSIMPVNPTPMHLTGRIISTSCNVVMALSLLEGYINSTYALQAADTELQAAISNQETTFVTNFENSENSAGGTLYQLEHLDPKSSTYASDVSRLSGQYSAENAANQAATKVMDGNNSTAQNTLSQNSQGQQGIITTMSSINSVAGNLTRIVQG